MSRLRSGIGGREHAYVEKRLSAYVDDEVSGRERNRIETHLAGCEACRAELRALRWTVGLLHQAPQVKAPRRFAVREADLLEAQQRVRSRAPLLVTQWATGVVALLFVLILGADLVAGRRISPFVGAPLSHEGERAAVTQVMENEPAVEQVTDEREERVAQALPEATPSAMPTLEAEVAAEAVPAESEESTEPPMAMKALEDVEATEAVTATEAAGIMSAAPAEPQGEPQGGGGLPPTPVPAPTEAPRVALQPQVTEPAPKLTQRVLPTPSEMAEAYGLTARGESEGAAGQDALLLWRAAEAILGVALVVLLVAVVWMRSRR